MGQELKICEEPKAGEEQKTCGAPNAPCELNGIDKPAICEERRRNPRLQCSGLAGVQTLPVSDKPCPAKIMDLSIGGCLMELERPLTLAVDQIVELIFCVNHMPFRVRGQARAVRSETLVGFQFPQLSERVRSQLQDLLRELIQQLKKLHQERKTNRTDGNDEKHHQDTDARLVHAPGALPIHGQGPTHAVRPAETRPANPVKRAESHRRWF